MWLDRFSAQSTPSGSPPPPQNRSYSPAPRRPSHLAPLALPARPSFSPRSSSLSLASNVSTSSLPGTSRPLNGSTLRQSVTNAPDGAADPLGVLQKIIGTPLKSRGAERPYNPSGSPVPSQIVEDVDFGDLSLQEFVRLNDEPPTTRNIVHAYSALSVEECTFMAHHTPYASTVAYSAGQL
jgi:hypothetical protein